MTRLCFVPFLILAFLNPGARAADQPLRLAKSIPLPGIQGRIDAVAIDSKHHRLFVSANTTSQIGVVDLEAGQAMKSLQSMAQPRGLLYLPETDAVVAASTGHAKCFFFNAESLQVIHAVEGMHNANRVGYDEAAKKLYLGHSGALAIIDPVAMADVGEIPLGAPPETFAIERGGKRLFVNLPTLNQVAVIDRETSMVITRWTLPDEFKANFSIALDEANHRMFIVCRKPSRLLVFDTDSGKIVATYGIINDCGDVFYDAPNRRLYLSCGGGTIDVFTQDSPDLYSLVARIPTNIGARSSLFVPELHQFFIVAPADRAGDTVLQIYDVLPASASAPTSRPASTRQTTSTAPAAVKTFDFDHDGVGTSPPSWKIEGTNQQGPLANWQVVDAPGDARSGRNVLTLTLPAQAAADTFNICWTDVVQFTNGQLEVAVKPVSGTGDQGGGPIWRVKDKNNYYIARLNPVEKNFGLYVVKDGKRFLLASAATDAAAGQWHTIKITHEGDHITGALDDKQLLDAHDNSIASGGGIGVWTKADAVSSFDNVTLTPSR